jgi:hypothetical protein
VDIDAVEQGAADLAKVVLDLARGAAALAGGIAVEAALTPVQITTATEYEVGVPVRSGIMMSGGVHREGSLLTSDDLRFIRATRTANRLSPMGQPGRPPHVRLTLSGGRLGWHLGLFTRIGGRK